MRTSPALTVIPARTLVSGPALAGLVVGPGALAPGSSIITAASDGTATLPGLGPPAPLAQASSARNAVIMATGTTLSRLSGFARVLAVIWALGQEQVADAYNLANTLPNLVYELLLGGVLSATLLPVVMEAVAKRAVSSEDEDLPAIVTFLSAVLVVGTALFWLAAPALMRLYLSLASGPLVGQERALATSWLRLFAPQLLFIGLTALCNALLNSRRRFGAVAFSPVVANVVTIVALAVGDHLAQQASLGEYRSGSRALWVVGVGTTGAYFIQLLVQLPALWRCHLRLRLVWRPRHPALHKIVRLSGWTLGVVVANQISFSLVALMADRHSGQFSAYVYAYTFMQLPYAVVAVSIAYAVAPDLAQQWSQGRSTAFASQVSYASKVVAILLVPGGVGYCLLARPVALFVSAHGHESLAKAGLTGSLLAIFALGMPGFSAYLLIMRAFQSKQDTRSMFWLYLGENALTVVGALALYPWLGVRGLAASWIGAYTLVLPVAWAKLRRSVPISVPTGWLSRLALATGVMALPVAIILKAWPGPAPWWAQLGRLAVLASAGAGTFWLCARLFGLSELKALSRRLRAALAS